MNFDDPFVRRLSKVVLATLTVVLGLVSLLAMAIVVDWYAEGQTGPGADTLVLLATWLPRLSGEKLSEFLNLVAILASAIPLMVTPVCFSQTSAPRRLNPFGRGLTLAFLLVLLVSTAAYLGLDPAAWKDGHALGSDGLTHVQDWAKAAIRIAVFYLAALLATKVST